MNPEFWHEKWAKNEIGFHLPMPHPLLCKHWKDAQLSWQLDDNSSVFVPLCGKSLDIPFLLEQGHKVVANELSETAVKALFDAMKLKPIITQQGELVKYQYQNLVVYAGDFFQLTLEQLGKVSAVYDRAALIALPAEMRVQYAKHLSSITANAHQFLITLDYDQDKMSGPPFSVQENEVKNLYDSNYKIEQLARKNIIEHEEKFASRGLTELYESVYLLG